MIVEQVFILIIACIVAVCCALPGVFLILRGRALMSDAISHSILLGIVLAFFAVQKLHSPFLIVGATLMGLVTVFVTESLVKSKKIKQDAAIGLVFPFFFSIAILLINQFANNTHLDADMVLLGELAFSPFNTLSLSGVDLGPVALWSSGIILIINLIFISFFYKELKITSFDAAFASAIGISPLLMHYLLMGLVSLTAVGAFEAVGSILVIAFMIVPPASAYLLTKRLSHMLCLSVFFALFSAILGYSVATILDLSISGSIVCVSGLLFLLVFLFSPSCGLVFLAQRHKNNQLYFSAKLLCIHLLSHEKTPQETQENSIENCISHMKWGKSFTQKVIYWSIKQGLLSQKKQLLFLSNLGREQAKFNLESR